MQSHKAFSRFDVSVPATGHYKATSIALTGGSVARKTPAKSKGALPIYVLNGPNLNLLGSREPEVYGRSTLAEIETEVKERAKAHGLSVTFRQSNHEGELIDWLQEARTQASGVILNAAGFSHTSVSILDACRMLDKPLIEVHLSNPYKREPFRRRSYISEAAQGVICGLGATGYLLAVDALSGLIKE
jgi:3-dehydroquinate dehydratase II